MYARFMLDHRITLQLNDVADPSHLAASAAAYAADYAPLIHGLDRASRLQSAQLTTVEYPWWQGGSASQSVQQARMGAWVANAKASGWFDKALDYTGDEPSSSAQWDAILNRGAWAHGVDPNFRTLVTTAVNSYNTFAGAGSGTVNVMVAVLDNLDKLKQMKVATTDLNIPLAQTDLVASAHSLRVLLVTLIIPFGFRHHLQFSQVSG